MSDHTNDIKALLDYLHGSLSADLRWAKAIRKLVAERDALAAEVAALKAHDPLAEMWRELEAYQEQANRDGHGESWARMCQERTQVAAFTAYAYAPSDADEAALAAARAINADDTESRAARESLANLEAWNAIAAIRKAREAKP